MIGRRVAGARVMELLGLDHLPWVGDTDSLLGEVEEFLTVVRRGPEPDRVLATILFTDIVESTQVADASETNVGATSSSGTTPLSGVSSMGECELIDGKLAGIAVRIAARVAALASLGEVLVSGTVKDLVVGSRMAFRDRAAVAEGSPRRVARLRRGGVNHRLSLTSGAKPVITET